MAAPADWHSLGEKEEDMRTRSIALSRLATGLTAGALLGFSSIGGVAAAPTSFPLMCRGGGAMDAAVISKRGGVLLGVTFAKATKAGTVQPPAPGTCTWIDRRIRPGEPKRFYLRVKGSLSLRCSAARCRVSMAPAGVWSIIKAIRQGKPFQVRVYNERNKLFKVTKIGP
jgi:hypothetical protein